MAIRNSFLINIKDEIEKKDEKIIASNFLSCFLF